MLQTQTQTQTKADRLQEAKAEACRLIGPSFVGLNKYLGLFQNQKKVFLSRHNIGRNFDRLAAYIALQTGVEVAGVEKALNYIFFYR